MAAAAPPAPFTRLAGRWRSMPAAASLLVFLLVAMGLAVIFLNERSYQAQKMSETRVQAEILAASVTAALDFRDGPAAADSVEALLANKEIRAAAVYDAQGLLFASFDRAGNTLSGDRAGLVSASVPVVSGGQRVGSTLIVLESEPGARRLTRYAIIGLFVLLAVIVAAILALAQAALRRANRELESRAEALVEANLELKVQMDEREKAEEQLRQAQKMQALGQLTGGIAHDFNNLLTVIQGSADILQRPNLAEEKRARFASAISQTAGRAAALTSQLLAFARRQPLRPETIDLNEQIVSMVDLLDRTIGERVQVRTELCSDLCVVDVDPVQLESAILNIAVNARDAMPEGGTLTLSTAPAPEPNGDRPAIALAIADTGKGLDAETVARVFEPFFTTKEVGKGTGLGLSQVYGFATQSGGDVTIDSVPGKGTTVTLILPCSADGAAVTDASGESDATPEGTTGCILVVDDNEEVGAFAEALLIELGHEVVRARSGEEALKLFKPRKIDVVFTDVVMPGISGLDLAARLREAKPSLPIILTTGFSDRISESGTGGLPVLFKPYKMDDLARALDQALAAPAK